MATGCGQCECGNEMTVVTGVEFPIWKCDNFDKCKQGGFRWPVPKTCPACKTETIRSKVVRSPDFCICEKCNAKTPMKDVDIKPAEKEELEKVLLSFPLGGRSGFY